MIRQAKKHIQIYRWALLFIGVCALMIRILPMPQSIQWQDTGTELLTAYHGANFHEYSLLGVYADNIHFFHPPWYLWSLSLGLNVVHNYLFLIYASALFHALAIIPVFAIATMIGGPITGILAGIFYAITPRIVELAWTLQSQNIIVPIVLWTIWIWMYAKKRNNHTLLYLSGILWIAATTVNYAAWTLAWIPFITTFFDLRTNPKAQRGWILLWTVGITVLYSPLILYFGVNEWINTLLTLPTILLHEPSNIKPHHANIFLPLIFIAVARIVEIFQKPNYSAVVRISTIAVVCIISVLGVWQSLNIAKKGDYVAIHYCANVVSQAIKTNLLLHPDDHIRFSQIDPEHTDNWTTLIVLIESTLHKQLVQLDEFKGYFIWKNVPSKSYILCLQPKKTNTDIFLTTTCPNQATHANNVTISLVSNAYPTHPCALYLLENRR